MKKHHIFGIIVLLSLLLALSGCGDKSDEAKPVPAQEVSEEVSEPASDAGMEDVGEPELPDDEVQDMGSDVTEETVSPETASDAEDSEAAEADDVSDEGEGVEDVGNESDELTAENYRVISLKDLHAYPEELHITVGTTVEWRNVNDNLQHIIGWKNQKQMGVTPEPILIGESWSYTFNEPGKITWFSTARPTIQGIIYIDE